MYSYHWVMLSWHWLRSCCTKAQLCCISAGRQLGTRGRHQQVANAFKYNPRFSLTLPPASPIHTVSRGLHQDGELITFKFKTVLILSNTMQLKFWIWDEKRNKYLIHWILKISSTHTTHIILFWLNVNTTSLTRISVELKWLSNDFCLWVVSFWGEG